MNRISKLGASALMLCLPSLLLAAGQARSSTFMVTSLGDTGRSGELRSAMAAANASAGSTIVFRSGLQGIITLSPTFQALPIMTVNTFIQGPGSSVIAIDGRGAYRPFSINAPKATVSITGLTIQHGMDAGATGGGAILLTAGNLNLTSCTLANNIATGNGGAISNFGTVSLTNCLLSNNKAYNGGALYNYTYAGNEGTATITYSTMLKNSSTINGGAIYDYTYSGTGGGSTITRCMLLQNTCGGNGGGVYNYSYSGSGGNAIVTNCVIANNHGIYGGGVFDYTYSGSGGISTMTYCTVTGNSGVYLGGIYNTTYSGSGGNASLTNCIVYGDPGGELFGAVTAVYSDIQGGHAGQGNINVNPLFNDPANLVYTLNHKSPCIGHGVQVTGITTDLRGRLRLVPSTIGAYEGSDSR
jgi:hypothetical protein